MNGYNGLVTDKLAEHGWYLFRHGKGAHDIWAHDSKKKRVTVSHNCKSRHTANAIMKQAGIKHKF